MAIGFGVYDALNAAPDFNAKRRDRLMEMQSLNQQTALVENQINQQSQARQAVQGQVDEMQALLSKQGFMQRDFDAIKGLEEQQRANIAKGIAEYGNDVRKFMLMGGGSQLSAYKNSLLQSEELRKGLQNVASLAQYQKDASDGKFIKNAVAITPDGKQASVDFNSAVNGYSNGQFSDFHYGGSEKMADINPEFYSKTPGPTHKYGVKMKDASGKTITAGEAVSPSQIYNQIRQSGFSEEQAATRANEYQQFVNNGGEPLRWGMDKFDWGNELHRLQYNNAKDAQGLVSMTKTFISGGMAQVVTNPDGTAKKLPGIYLGNGRWQIVNEGYTQGDATHVKNIQEAIGLSYDEKNNTWKDSANQRIFMTPSGFAFPNNGYQITNVGTELINRQPVDENGNPTGPVQAYFKANVFLTDSQAEAIGIMDKGFSAGIRDRLTTDKETYNKLVGTDPATGQIRLYANPRTGMLGDIEGVDMEVLVPANTNAVQNIVADQKTAAMAGRNPKVWSAASAAQQSGSIYANPK